MMKHTLRILGIIVISAIIPLSSFADEDCDQALKEARQAYNAGNYSKAKGLFDYVVSECGSSYGNAGSMSRQCADALKPTLSVSRSNISVGASSGSTTITVTSNRSWKLQNASSSMFTVYVDGNTITINYTANSKSSPRVDYFDVVTTDGTLSRRVEISQSAAYSSSSSTLMVSRTSISASASATTEYITVTCSRSWELQYPSGNMYSVTRNGNQLTVKIFENTSSSERTDFFYVKTTDGNYVQKISLTQSGKSSSSSVSSTSKSYATIDKVWVEHNVYQDGQKGMMVHVKLNAYNVYSHTIRVCVYYYYRDGDALRGISGSSYTTSDGKASVSSTSTANYTNTIWNDFTIFMPYDYLNMASGCKDLPLEGQVGVYDDTKSKWLTNSYTKFYFNFSN